MRFPIAAALAAAMLAACTPGGASADKEAAAAKAVPGDPSGFKHTDGADLFGHYLPTQPVKVGNWELRNFHIGDEEAFDSWEANDRTETYAPVMLEFDDVTSPKATNELGGEYHTVSERILPSGYAIANDSIAFLDTDSRLGRVAFKGRFDLAAVVAAKREGANPETVVLTGTLTVGDKTFENLAFTWYGGD